MLMTVKDLQKTLNVGRDTAYALMRADAFPSIKIGGRYYVTRTALDAWLCKYEYKSFTI